MVSKRYIVLFFTASGLLHFFYRWLERVATRAPSDWRGVMVDEMTGSYAAMVLLPGILRLVRRHPWRRATWTRWVPAHLAGAVAYSLVKTSLQWGSRVGLFAVFGMGWYDYGLMPVRYLMELPADLLSYGMLCAVSQYLMNLESSRRMQLALEQARLENLNLQLQPHFLFNAMNAISATVYESPRRADLMLSRLAEYLRRTLERREAQEVALEEEIELLELYLDVMRARFEDGLSVEIRVDAAVRGARVPQMLLQPIVENAIRHGGPAGVAVWIDRRDGDLTLRVRDAGGGEAAPGLGIGLSNTAERLRSLYGDRGRVRLDRGPAGTEVLIELPCRID